MIQSSWIFKQANCLERFINTVPNSWVEEQAFRPALLALKRPGFSPGDESLLFMKHALIRNPTKTWNQHS